MRKLSMLPEMSSISLKVQTWKDQKTKEKGEIKDHLGQAQHF